MMSILHETKHVSHGDKEVALTLRPLAFTHKDFLTDAGLVSTCLHLCHPRVHKLVQAGVALCSHC